MLRVWRVWSAVTVASLVLSGCWSSHELTDWGLVQAAAVDRADDNKILLTTQIYKPGGGASQDASGKPASSFIETNATSITVQGASQDTSLKLGRRLQWSHSRVLLIGEETARGIGISSILDYFSRNHDFRGSNALMITKGKAAEFLRQNPLIENTMGQQLKSVEENSMLYTGKSLQVSMTDVNIASKSQVPLTVIPYAVLQKNDRSTVAVAGLAIIRFPDGRMIGFITPAQAPYFLMLINRFHSGVVELSCGAELPGADSFLVGKAVTKLKPEFNGEQIHLKVSTELSGVIGQLGCRPVVSKEETDEFIMRVQEKVKAELTKTLEHLLKEKSDVLGIGEHIYRTRKSKWKTLKPDWPEIFAKMDFEITVKARIQNAGSDVAKPFPG